MIEAEKNVWFIIHPTADLGYIPGWLSDKDERPCAEQLNENYMHGGGWRPFKGTTDSKFSMDPLTKAISYPGDPTFSPLAYTQIRDEIVLLYPHAWVAILQKDGSFEICRMD